MSCKNCHTPLPESANYCANCGSQIVRKRLSFKTFIVDFFTTVFGWDSGYFLTLKTLIVKPELVLHGYVDGLRKKYVTPLTFFAVGITISLLVFNAFQDHFLLVSTGGEMDMETMQMQMPQPVFEIGPEDAQKRDELAKAQMAIMIETQQSVLNYFNAYSFLFLPLYTLMALLVFGKPYNYTEHLVINAYLQGILFLSTALFFLLSLVLWPELYLISVIPSILYYSYAYGRLYKQSFAQIIAHLFKFVGIAIIAAIILLLISVLIGMVISKFRMS